MCRLTYTYRDERYVVLKIGCADQSRSEEVTISRYLASMQLDHGGRSHVRTVLRDFVHRGVNGHHSVLVFEPLGRSFADIIVNHERPNPESRFQNSKPWPLAFTRQIVKQLLMGLDFLHSAKVMHRDIQPGNILLGLNYDIDTLTEDELQRDVSAQIEQYGSSNIINLERKDGTKLHESDPKYLVGPTSLGDRVNIEDNPLVGSFRAVLIDLGAASTFENSGDGQHKYPTVLRPPEAILKIPIGPKADIFNLGCVIFQIITLENAFRVDTYGEPDEVDDDHMKVLIQRLGPLPATLQSQWPRARQWINEKGELLEQPPPDKIQLPLKENTMLLKPNDMTVHEAEQFADFLSKMLHYDPDRRADTSELLRHPWITQTRQHTEL